MRDVGDERRNLASDEYRRDDVDVGQVRAAAVVRIVGDEHVAPRDFLQRVAPEDLVDRTDHRAQMDRHALRERDHLALRVKNRGRAIGTLLDVGRERGAHQGCAHFLGGREQITRHDFGLDRIDAMG